MKRINFKKALILIFITFLLIDTTGCAPLRKKFVRKPKEKEEAIPILTTKEYGLEYSRDILYNKHYVFWKTWHMEAIESIGENDKKTISCINNSINQLKTLQGYLVDEKKALVDPHIKFLEDANKRIAKGRLAEPTINNLKKMLEKEKRVIQNKLFYKKVEPWIKKND